MTTPSTSTSTPLVEHFFRHEYSRLVASLARRVGVRHLDAVEDAVQSALISAIERWPTAGQPSNPSAWLFRVAYNQLLDELRRTSRQARILQLSSPTDRQVDVVPSQAEIVLAGEIQDDLLRMLFACCDQAVAADSQLVLALQILCGFSVREISLRLFIGEANVYKRLGRARQRLRRLEHFPEQLTAHQTSSRLPAVHRILYLMFTEGHLSSHASTPIRLELCNEAMRLGELLAKHPAGQTPETFALLALMHLHTARINARQDRSGGLLLLEEQDREQWDRQHIEFGMVWLARSATGDEFTRFHAEAGIAAEHCRARTFTDTDWQRIAECYELLEDMSPSAIHRLNRAVAVAEWRGPAAGLAVLEESLPPTWLVGSYLWAAVQADLHRRLGHVSRAARYREQAIGSAPSAAIEDLLQRRLTAG